jgi:hypothetical protein
MADSPRPPTYNFATPFCDAGARTQIPVETDVPGRASLAAGFPTETQLPLTQGGVAPNRLDVNGALWALSAFAWWQQSGGQFAWKPALNYAKPALVFHGDVMWWCLAANGPGNPAGVVEPGTDGTVWREYLLALADQIVPGGGGGSTNIFGGNPVGTVIMYYGMTAPDGYLKCDNSPFSASIYPKLYAVLGKATTPDLRGLFIRGLDQGKGLDPNRTLGTTQQDAGREISGQAPIGDGTPYHDNLFQGCFRVGPANIHYGNPAVDVNNPLIYFEASRCWGQEHTAAEFRPVNAALLYCIKHD